MTLRRAKGRHRCTRSGNIKQHTAFPHGMLPSDAVFLSTFLSVWAHQTLSFSLSGPSDVGFLPLLFCAAFRCDELRDEVKTASDEVARLTALLQDMVSKSDLDKVTAELKTWQQKCEGLGAQLDAARDDISKCVFACLLGFRVQGSGFRVMISQSASLRVFGPLIPCLR
jgi:hypothetical protein